MKSPALKLTTSIVVLMYVAGCDESNTLDSFATPINSVVPYDTTPDIPDATVADVANDNFGFAIAMYRQLIAKHEDNMVFSPFSISSALSMTYAGAAADTAGQMRTALNFRQSDSDLFSSFSVLNQSLADANTSDYVTLRSVNTIWAADGLNWKQPFVNTLTTHYVDSLNQVDFQIDAETIRKRVNAWIAEQTEDRIKDLLPEGIVTPQTAMLLTNAVYLDAKWKFEFDPDRSKSGEFKQLSGNAATVQYMNQLNEFKHTRADSFDVVELPYGDDKLSMVILLPDINTFTQFETDLSATRVNAALTKMQPKTVRLSLPKFTFEYEAPLNKPLSNLGMTGAFTQSADFSLMTDDRQLMIDAVMHKAFVNTDEAGTEAAAATGVMVNITSAPTVDVDILVNRPFVFLIRDLATSNVVFLGRVTSP